MHFDSQSVILLQTIQYLFTHSNFSYNKISSSIFLSMTFLTLISFILSNHIDAAQFPPFIKFDKSQVLLRFGDTSFFASTFLFRATIRTTFRRALGYRNRITGWRLYFNSLRFPLLTDHRRTRFSFDWRFYS